MNTAEQLLQEHHGFVAQRANMLAAFYPVDVDDLIQEGRRGILRAMETYDPNHGGGNFLTYAKFWIIQHQMIWIRKTCDQVRVPANKFRKLGFSERSLQSFLDEDELAFESCVGRDETVRSDADQANIRQVLELAIEQLSPANARVIRGYFFDGLNSMQLAEKFGITHQAVNMAKWDALKKLRAMKLVREELAHE
jgi:RNA polymerase sigma factor (sigma-70 family)